MIASRVGRRRLRRSQSYWTQCYADQASQTELLDPSKVSRCLVENGQVDQMDMTSADNAHEGTVAWYCRDL